MTDSTTIHNLIDFGDYPVFEEAIAYPSIITLSKAKSENNQLQALAWDETKKQDISQFATALEQDGLKISQENLKPDGWRLESSKNFDLLAKLRNVGKPLSEYVNGKIYYAEVSIHTPEKNFGARVEAEDTYTAIDLLKDELSGNITHYKDRTRTLHKKDAQKFKEELRGIGE